MKRQFLPKMRADWAVVPGRAILRQRHERSKDGSESLLSVSEYYGVLPKADVVEDGDFLTRAATLEDYRLCAPGDLVINIMLAWKRGLGVSQYEGIVSPSYAVFRFLDGANPRYYNYLLRTDAYCGLFGAYSTGVVPSRWRLYPEVLMQLPILRPPQESQIQIADFLDGEIAKVDALVAKYERLIELLEENRDTLIAKAVTKGLNPTVPMKDSGIPSVGVMPAHWQIKRVKHAFTFLDGRRIPLSSEQRSSMQGDYAYYGASGVIDRVDNFLFDEDLILVSEDGANLLNRSTSIAFIARGKYWVNNHAHILKPKDDALEFWAERLEVEELAPYVTGSAQPKLTIEALSNITISAPADLDERREIAAYVQDVNAKAKSAVDAAQCGIQLLREHKGALITAAVTGQIDVRTYKAKDLEEVFA